MKFPRQEVGKATAAIILSLPLMPTHKLPSLYTTKPLKSFTTVCQCKLSIRHTLSIPFSLLINNTLQTQPLPVDQRAASWEMTSKLGLYCSVHCVVDRYLPQDSSLQSETVHFKRGVCQQFCLPSHYINLSEWADEEVTHLLAVTFCVFAMLRERSK